MAGCEETCFIQRKEGSLFYRFWTPEQSPKAVICLVHGLGDHSGCFLRFAAYFTSAGFAVAAMDLYGHGHSDGKRGDVPQFSLLLDEVMQLMEDARKRYPGLPLFLYGHSMGGNIVLNTSLRRQPAVAGVVASAPWLEMVAHPIRRAVLARMVSLVNPQHCFDSGLHPEGLSHDPEFAAFYLTDPFVHGLVSARLFWQASSAGIWARRHASETRLPTLVIHGEADPITSAAASKQYAAQSGGMAVYRGFRGTLHTLHHELNKAEIFQTVQQWMEDLLEPHAAVG